MIKENLEFEKNFNGIDISKEKVVELFNYLIACKPLYEREEILKCTFRKKNNKVFSFDGISVDSINNMTFDGTIMFSNNMVIVNKNVHNITNNQNLDTIDKFEKIKGKVVRTSSICGKVYKDNLDIDFKNSSLKK